MAMEIKHIGLRCAPACSPISTARSFRAPQCGRWLRYAKLATATSAAMTRPCRCGARELSAKPSGIYPGLDLRGTLTRPSATCTL